MRRKDREITDQSTITSIIRESTVCRLGLSIHGQPYVVPLCFGFENRTLFFHSARAGRKLEILRANPRVCFEFDLDHEVIEADRACDWTLNYRSVMGFGKASFVEDIDEKRRALDVIFQQYSQRPVHFPENELKRTVVIKVRIDRLAGKQSIS